MVQSHSANGLSDLRRSAVDPFDFARTAAPVLRPLPARAAVSTLGHPKRLEEMKMDIDGP